MQALGHTLLHDAEAAHGARFVEHHGWEVPGDFGEPRREYDAVRCAAGALDLGYLGKIAVSGRDRVRYLHNMLSNDIKGLAAGAGCYAALLTHQGRMESDLYVHAFADELRLECGPAGKDRLAATLQKFIVADVVTLEDRTSELAILSLQGPEARERMEEAAGQSLDGLAELGHRAIGREGGDWVVVRRDRTGYGGYDLWLHAREAAEVWTHWTGILKVPSVGLAALDALRTEAGIPWYGSDMDETTLPMEMGLDHAISMTKGCYRGQEIVARVLHRGHLDRKLAGIAVGHTEPPRRGHEVRSEGARVGAVTSAVWSPRLEKPLALAVLKNDYRAPGTEVEVVYGDAAHPGTVVALPLRS
jgi:glycine cleavage system T protein